MKRFLMMVVCLTLSARVFSQSADQPAPREDVVRLLQTMKSHDMMEKTMQAVLTPMKQMTHEQWTKDKDRLPADFESRMDKMMADMMKNMPIEEMTEAMIPVYQKHFTHSDIEALIAFYSSPVGQKFLEETPKVTGEAMQTMMPIINNYSQKWQERIQKEVEDMEENPSKANGSAAPKS